MSLAQFQCNLHAWIRRTFSDRVYIMGNAKDSLENRKPRPWPDDPKVRPSEMKVRTYQLIAPWDHEIPPRMEWRDALAAMLAPFPCTLRYANPHEGDLNFIHAMPTFSGSLEDIMGRLYFHFDHTNRDHSGQIAVFLGKKLAAFPFSMVQFKVAGLQVDPACLDSAVIYLSEAGLLRLSPLLSGMETLPLLEPEVPGTRKLGKGVGFCMALSQQSVASGWKARFSQTSSSFGLLLSTYLAHGLSFGDPDLDSYADRVAALMKADGIDPMAVWKLSAPLRHWKGAEANLAAILAPVLARAPSPDTSAPI